MKTRIHFSHVLLIIIIAGLSSCMSQYPKYTGHYHPKIDNNVVASSKQQPVERSTNDVKPLPQPNSFAWVTTEDMKPQIEASQMNIVSATSHKIKNHKAVINVSNTSQQVTNNKTNIYSFAVQNIASARHYYHDGDSNHLLVRGLIFLIVGLLLQGLWAVAGPFGILIAIVGIVCIIYGLILILESI